MILQTIDPELIAKLIASGWQRADYDDETFFWPHKLKSRRPN